MGGGSGEAQGQQVAAWVAWLSRWLCVCLYVPVGVFFVGGGYP